MYLFCIFLPIIFTIVVILFWLRPCGLSPEEVDPSFSSVNYFLRDYKSLCLSTKPAIGIKFIREGDSYNLHYSLDFANLPIWYSSCYAILMVEIIEELLMEITIQSQKQVFEIILAFIMWHMRNQCVFENDCAQGY